MASIVQRGKSYSVVYTKRTNDGKKQKWETYYSYDEAVRRKEQIELVQTHEKLRLNYQEGSLTKLLDEYIELYGRFHWSYSTYTSNIALIKNYIIPFMGSMQLSEFTPKTVAALYRQLMVYPNFSNLRLEDRPMTPQILTNIHKLLHSAFEQAVLWEYVDRNPFHKVSLPKSLPKQISMLSPEEIRLLLCECDDPLLTTAVHLAFAGSLRKGEIMGLTWDDIDFSVGSISVRKTLKRIRRDAIDVIGGKDVLYQFPPVFDEGRTVTVLKRPKTQSSIRTVYLPPYVMDVLSTWKAAQKPCQKTQPDLVLRYSNGRPLQEDTLLRLLERQLLILGLPKVTFHSLRHSSITYKLVLTGGNIKAVQGDSGHAQAEMITERYGHIIDACRKQCAQSFQDQFYQGL